MTQACEGEGQTIDMTHHGLALNDCNHCPFARSFRYRLFIFTLNLLNRIGTGITKRFLSIDDEHQTTFCYYERGTKVQGQPSIVFIHGFSGDKGSWISVVKKIPRNYHCIMIDLPYHGETVGSYNDNDQINSIIHKLKLFCDKLNMTTPFCLVGASMGGAIVTRFSTTYPEYVSMICLMAPPPCEEYESELVRRARRGSMHILLPSTSAQFHSMSDILVIKKNVPKFILELMFQERLPYLDVQTKLLESVFEGEYMNLDEYYKQFKNMNYPTLILWGREDKICTIEGMDYFCETISHAEVIVFDDCGHFITHDKTEETAKALINFVDCYSYCQITAQEIDGN